jgi:hypothetical protein
VKREVWRRRERSNNIERAIAAERGLALEREV